MSYAAPRSYHAKLSASENHKGYTVRDCNMYLVADVSPRDEDGAEGKRLATLIHAAPAMLEALEKYIAWCAAEDNHALVSFQTRNQMCRDAEDAARAAVKAAKGEA